MRWRFIAGKLPKNAPEGKRVLIATPYDYQFKAINEHDKGAFKKRIRIRILHILL